VAVSESPAETFERLALPHAGACLRLARVLAKNDSDADDIVQEAYARAYRYFHAFVGDNARAWLLAIVRNAAWAHLGRPIPSPLDESSDATIDPRTPELSLIEKADALAVKQAVSALPPEFREVVVLRELEELSYKEIAQVAQIPIGTVMSRLARGRRLLATRLQGAAP
jgi:RNA polymerase sigma-70 factor (ECF subfamily)